MRKQRIVAPPIGTMYQVSYYSKNHNNVVEYWQVERRTERTVWLRRLVTNMLDQPIPGMVRSDLGLLEPESSQMGASASMKACTCTPTPTSTRLTS